MSDRSIAAGVDGPTAGSALPGYLATDERVERVLITEREIQARVTALAGRITADYGSRRPHVLGVLNGAFMFTADLTRALRRSGLAVAGCGFIRSSAYGDVIRTQGSDAPFVSLGTVPESVVGQDVLLVEDILDQGVTLHALVSRIRESGVRSLKLCVLLDKQLETPSDQVLRLRADLALDYVGFRVPDRWLAGYGLDAAGEYRDLPCIAVLREEFFTNPSPP